MGLEGRLCKICGSVFTEGILCTPCYKAEASQKSPLVYSSFEDCTESGAKPEESYVRVKTLTTEYNLEVFEKEGIVDSAAQDPGCTEAIKTPLVVSPKGGPTGMAEAVGEWAVITTEFSEDHQPMPSGITLKMAQDLKSVGLLKEVEEGKLKDFLIEGQAKWEWEQVKNSFLEAIDIRDKRVEALVKRIERCHTLIRSLQEWLKSKGMTENPPGFPLFLEELP